MSFALLLLFISIGCLFGFGNLFFKLARLKMEVNSVVVWSGLAALAVNALILSTRTDFTLSWEKTGVFWSVFSGICSVLGGYLFLVVIGPTRLSIVSPLLSALPILVSVLSGVLVLGERLSPFEKIGIVSILGGVILLVLPKGGQ